METKSAVLDALRRIDAGASTDYRAVADALRQPVARSSVPAEDSRARLSDRDLTFLRRLPALLALLSLLFAAGYLAVFTVRTVWGETRVQSGGGFLLEYSWDGVRPADHWMLFTANAALILAAAALIVYLVRGGRRRILLSGALCVGCVLCLLLLPAGDADSLLRLEFLAVRHSVWWKLFFSRPNDQQLRLELIGLIKYWPVLVSAVFAAVGFFIDRKTERTEMQKQQ